MSSELKAGDLAPDFCELAVGGKYGVGREVSLVDFRGSPLVLYFYPKDDTPGCATQACGLRDAWNDLAAQAEIFGVSVNSAESHEKFITKYQLPFPLLSDPGHEIVTAYGVWVEKSMSGRTDMGVERTTVVIGSNGHISVILRKVKPSEHAGLLKRALAPASE